MDLLFFFFFFFKQKTAYEMRISDWSSDVCSSDLLGRKARNALRRGGIVVDVGDAEIARAGEGAADREIIDRRVQQRRHGVDEIGAAAEASGGVDEGRVDADQLEKIAVVGIAVAERDDSIDALRRSGRGPERSEEPTSELQSLM